MVLPHALGPRGEKHSVTDATHEHGIPAERCARVIVRAVVRGKEEVVVGGPEVAAIYLQRWAPWLFSQIARRLKFSK